MVVGGALAACGGPDSGIEPEAYVEAWAAAFSSGDVYDTVAFYEPDVQISIAQPDLELTFSAGTWDATTQGEGRSWLANWLDRQTSPRPRTVEAVFAGVESVSAVVLVDDLDTAAWYAWEMGGTGIAGQQTLRWRDAHKPLGAPDPRLAPIDALLADYVDAWAGAASDRVAGLYGDRAVFEANGVRIEGVDAIAEAAAGHALDGARLVEIDAGSRRGPAVFVGRVERGEPVGFVVETTDEAGCVQRIATTITVESGVITSERRQPDPEAARRCGQALGAGWWQRLGPPPPLEEWVTGELPNEDGSAIEVVNGTPELEAFVGWALGRFTDAGLDQPILDSVTFGPVPACAGRAGAVFDDDVGSPALVQCTDAYAACVPAPADCGAYALSARFSLLHELAHVWLIQNVDDGTQAAFLEVFGITTWDDRQVPWHRRGVEHGAEVLAWGLLDEVVPLERIDDPPCEQLAEAWGTLTSTGAPHDCG